jgi:hypothetical protein
MEDLHTVKEKETGRIEVFVPNARHLTDEEIMNLHESKLELAKEVGAKGVWLEVDCPDQVCVLGEGKIALHVMGAPDKETESLWMRLFCPEDRCFARQPSHVPS